jgi:hypothetical protein
VIGLGLGSMEIGGITTSAVFSSGKSPDSSLVVVVIWIIIGVINVAYARRR